MTTVTYLLIALAVIYLLLFAADLAAALWRDLAAANDRAVDRMVTEALGENNYEEQK